VAEKDRAYPLDELSDEELRPRVDAIQKAIAILKSNGIKVNVNGDFVTALARRLEGVPAGVEVINSYELPQGMTRDCTDPWTYAELETNGDVKPCCARTGVGNLANQELSQILSGDRIRQLRADLLGGTPDSDCAKCHLKGPSTPQALSEKVQELLQDESRGKYFDTVFSNRILFLLQTALDHLKAGRLERTWSCVNKALALDPGIPVGENYGDITIRAHLDRILKEATVPLTLTALAAICREIGDREASNLLLQRYLELAPNAADWDRVADDISVSTLSQTIVSHEKALAWQRTQLKDLEARLTDASAQLSSIHASLGWRSILRWRRMRDRLLPVGSSRWRLLEKLMRHVRNRV
jgi:hypothetical protein